MSSFCARTQPAPWTTLACAVSLFPPGDGGSSVLPRLSRRWHFWRLLVGHFVECSSSWLCLLFSHDSTGHALLEGNFRDNHRWQCVISGGTEVLSGTMTTAASHVSEKVDSTVLVLKSHDWGQWCPGQGLQQRVLGDNDHEPSLDRFCKVLRECYSFSPS